MVTGATGVEEAALGRVVTSGSSEEATVVSATISSSGMLAVGEYSVCGTEVGVAWLETWSAVVVGCGRVVPGLDELVESLASVLSMGVSSVVGERSERLSSACVGLLSEIVVCV